MRRFAPAGVIMTFGPGALLDTENRANYMVLGPDSWYAHRPIREHRLARSLDARPLWRARDGNHRSSPPQGWTCRRPLPAHTGTVRFASGSLRILTARTGPPQRSEAQAREVPTIGPRLVAACTRGHIQDFPWGGWVAAKGGHKSCTCAHGAQRLRLTGGGLDAENSDLAVQCDVCDGRRSLEGALKPLRFTCGGYRPWDRPGIRSRATNRSAD